VQSGAQQGGPDPGGPVQVVQGTTSVRAPAGNRTRPIGVCR